MKICNEWVTPREVAKWVEEVTGEEVEIKEVNDAAWPSLRTPDTEELWLNLECFYTAPADYRDVELTRRLVPNAKTTKQFIQEWGKNIVQ